MESLIEVGAFEHDTAREPEADDINRLPGPVSWLGSGAVNGSSRYLLAHSLSPGGESMLGDLER